MNLFKTKVIAPKSGSNNFAPLGVVEAGFQLAYLANDAEVESFRLMCIDEIERVCATHVLRMLTVAEMIRYRLRHERYIHRVAESPVHTR